MKRHIPFFFILAVIAGLLAIAFTCPGCVVIDDDPYIPVPPDPIDPVDPVDPVPPVHDASWPPADITTYGEDVWSQIKEGMTRAEVFALMPTYWKSNVVEGKRSFVYVTDETHANGFPKVFIVRFPEEPNDDTVKVVETSEQPF